MFDRVLVEVVVLVHMSFVLFVALGGLLLSRWPHLAWIHLPAAAWGAILEFAGFVCPLTPLELWLRARAGFEGYDHGFIEHYLLPVLYPADLTRATQIALGAAVIAINAVGYGRLLIARRRRSRAGGSRSVPRASGVASRSSHTLE